LKNGCSWLNRLALPRFLASKHACAHSSPILRIQNQELNTNKIVRTRQNSVHSSRRSASVPCRLHNAESLASHQALGLYVHVSSAGLWPTLPCPVRVRGLRKILVDGWRMVRYVQILKKGSLIPHKCENWNRWTYFRRAAAIRASKSTAVPVLGQNDRHL
jgi:hypothetical protein